MAWWEFKSCPRCDGDMFIDRDLYGWYEQCIQCGHVRDLRSVVKLRHQAWKKKGGRVTILSKEY